AKTRRGAALALLNMKSFAAPAESALRQAAEKEQDSQGREFARMALQELKSEQEQPSPGTLSKQDTSTVERLASEKDAIRRFRAVRADAGLASAPGERPSARRELLRNCLARINGALRPNEK